MKWGLIILLLPVICLAGQQSSRSPGIISLFHCNGDIKDEIGLPYTNTGAVSWDTGKLYKACKFTGASNSFIQLSDRAEINPVRITLFAMLKLNNYDTTACRVVSKDLGSAGNREYLFQINSSGGLQSVAWNTSNTIGNAICDAGSVKLGVWQSVAMTYDGANVIGYVNGVECKRAALTGDMKNGTNVLGIGASTSGAFIINGLMDEISLFNRALTPAELKKMTAEGLGRVSVD